MQFLLSVLAKTKQAFLELVNFLKSDKVARSIPTLFKATAVSTILIITSSAITIMGIPIITIQFVVVAKVITLVIVRVIV